MSQIKLESYPLWIKASENAIAARTISGSLHKNDWSIKMTLVQSSFEVTDKIARGYGSFDLRDKEWAYGQARGLAASFYNCVRQIENLGLVETNITLLQDIQDVIDLLDNEINKISPKVPGWLNRYTQKEDAS